ncbi:MAG: penicillin acylase family protein [Actinobacteria bacterium]|nr:penicillin acylase family protein [Actinomycetota bacterium]MBU1942167.1 penicillin acylase family protein [Actinomycetota bacterium]MBU2686251.1 penicillin acylase family protein [Actinomycetota bacterium]
MAIERKLIKGLFLGVFGVIGGGAGYLSARLFLSKPRNSGVLRLDCLDSTVEVIYDRAGIPHIFADNDLDGFRALGFVVAQDRLVQIQMMIALARGRLSELVGAQGLEMDRFVRTLGIEQAARKMVSTLKPESLEVINAFGQGINAYISQGGVRLPFEFMFMGGRPERWTPLDCMSVYLYVVWMLDTWWTSDVMRERLIRSLGMERARQLLPETTTYNNPPYKEEGTGVLAETLEPGEEIDWGFERGTSGGEWMEGLGPIIGYGSNNWVVSGARTTTGKPLLASDPHMQHNAPGLLYLFHLNTPNFDAAGAGFPGLPAVAFGHNGYCGWAATNLDADTIDLYVETFESEESDRYLYEGEWLEADVVTEEIRVRFSKPRLLRVLVTRHGPVVRRVGNKGLALRWLSNEVHMDAVDVMLRQCRAGSWEQFVSPMDDYLGPCSNQVYADVDGNIGYQAAGKIPVRRTGDGTIPYDGRSAEYEWTGVIPTEEMPRVLNPAEGFIATANSKATSDGYPWLISREWNAPFRNARISELILAKEKHSPEDMLEMQADVFTRPGMHFSLMVVQAASDAGAGGLTPPAAGALELLRTWDFRADRESVAMSVYFYSWLHLRRMILEHRLGSALFKEYLCNWTTVDLAVENILDAGDEFWLPPGCGSFDEALLTSLEEGVRELAAVFGTDNRSRWKWGSVHQLELKYPFGLVWPLDTIFNVGPVPADGDGSTVRSATLASDSITQVHSRGAMGGYSDMKMLPRLEDHSAYGGSVLRMVLDFSDLDNSSVVLDMGQSGHRLSRHYKDHFPVWYRAKQFPFPYSREKILENRESTLVLEPTRARGSR